VVKFLAQKCAKPKRGRLVLGNAEMNYGKEQASKQVQIILIGWEVTIIEEAHIGKRTGK